MGWLQVELSPDLLGTVVDRGDGGGGKRRGERSAGERWGLKHHWDSLTVILSQAGDCKHPFSNSSCSPCVAEKRK